MTKSNPPAAALGPALVRDLAAAIESQGGVVHSARRATRLEPDVVFELGGARYVAELKTSPVNRVAHLQALVAAALLESRRLAAEIGAQPLAVLGVERLTDRTFAAIQKYVDRVEPHAAWGVMDRHGRKRFRGSSLAILDDEGRAPQRRERGAGGSLDPFSDFGQWMAKVLLARRLPPEMLAAPRARVDNARALSAVAGVSAPTAARWVQHTRREGFVELHDDGLALVRRRAFFERWRRALGHRRREIPARFLLPARSIGSHLGFALSQLAYERVEPFDPADPPGYPGAVAWKQGPRAALGMFGAAAGHGMPFVQGAPTHLYVEEVTEESLALFGLTEVRRGERTDVFVVQPRFPESTFRGVVMVQQRDGARIPVVDVLQTWLEVADHAARGREQADDIERRVIQPWLLEGDEDGAPR